MDQDEGNQPRLHEILRGLRQASGRSQEQWGALLGVGRSTIARYESGRSIPDAIVQIELKKTCQRLALLRRYGTNDGILNDLDISGEFLDQLFQNTRSQSKFPRPQAGPPRSYAVGARRLCSSNKVAIALAVLIVTGAVSIYFVLPGNSPIPVELGDPKLEFSETGKLRQNTQELEGFKVTLGYDFDIAGRWFGVLYPVKDGTLTKKHSILQVEVLGDADFEIKPNDIRRDFVRVGDGIYELSTSKIEGPMSTITLVVKRTINVTPTGEQTFYVRVRE